MRHGTVGPIHAPVLPALGKALVQVGADDALVQLGAADVLHAVQRILVRVVLDEAEAAGRLLEAVEAHDEALDLAALGEQLVDLLLGGVEGQVADVEGSRVLELLIFGRGLALALAVAAVLVASSVLAQCQRASQMQETQSTLDDAYELALSSRSTVLFFGSASMAGAACAVVLRARLWGAALSF